MSCSAWEDGEHQFRPGFMVRRPTLSQQVSEAATGVPFADNEVHWSFTPLDKDDHRTEAKQCACGLLVKAKAKR